MFGKKHPLLCKALNTVAINGRLTFEAAVNEIANTT